MLKVTVQFLIDADMFSMSCQVRTWPGMARNDMCCTAVEAEKPETQ